MASMTSPLFGADNTDLDTVATEYNRINAIYPSSWTGTESLRSTVVGSDFDLSSFNMTLSTAPTAGNSYTFTVMKNGTATALALTISDANVSSSNTSDSVSFVAGDTISIRCAPTGTPVAIPEQWWGFIVTTSDLTAPLLTGTSTPSTTLTQYTGLTAGQVSTSGWSTTEVNMQIIAPTSGTISDFYATLSSAPGAGTSRQFTVMHNGLASALDLTISDTSVAGSNTANSVSLSAGDTLTIRAVPTGSVATTQNASFGIKFTPTTPGESFFGFGSAAAPSATTTNYEQPLGIGNNGWTSTESNRILIPGAFAISAMYIKIGTAPGAGNSRTFTARKTGANTAVTATISGTNTTGNVTASAAYTQGDNMTIQSSIAGTPAAATGGVHIGFLVFAEPTSDFIPQVIIY